MTPTLTYSHQLERIRRYPTLGYIARLVLGAAALLGLAVQDFDCDGIDELLAPANTGMETR